jgi:N-acetylglucosaminyl-diphospho-decaprenol L-rhamnosyltransferase
VKAELSIIIVNWNAGELLRRCIKSIAISPPGVPYEIIVVDNASTDENLAWLKESATASLLGEAKLRLIENRENVGFSRANNQAIAESEADELLMLNPDTEVTPGAIATLIKSLRSDRRIGACGPRLVNTDGSLQHSVWPNPPTPWGILFSGLGLWRLLPKPTRGTLLWGGHWDHASRRPVPMLFGAAILAKREMISEIGGMDERFHMYCEDNEWCLRATRAGWRLVFEPEACVIHHGGYSSSQRWSSQEQLRMKFDSNVQFQHYSLSRPHVITNLLAGCLVMSVHRVWRLLRRRRGDDIAMMLGRNWAELKSELGGGDRPPVVDGGQVSRASLPKE